MIIDIDHWRYAGEQAHYHANQGEEQQDIIILLGHGESLAGTTR
jgi:hypothetical protein